MDHQELKSHLTSRPGGPPVFHPLSHHLAQVARRAGEFARLFGSGWAALLGAWHDLGKALAAFQEMLARVAQGLSPGRKVKHAIVGAVQAVKVLPPPAGRLLAYALAGHHAGLPDWRTESGGQADLAVALSRDEPLWAEARAAAPGLEEWARALPPDQPWQGRDPALWVRLLFSCLVDADRLDAEAFGDPDKAARRGQYPPLSRFLDQYQAYMAAKEASARPSPVNALRRRVNQACLAQAERAPGGFTLSVPTGGGKTLASLGFALAHARRWDLERVIYVIPYLSIIEQTADQFRDIFGAGAVLEHHSNVAERGDGEESAGPAQLAAENWDAPLIVTTAVQFFESLFAAHPSRCRKLHNIVNSVVVLDEAQLLPPDFLDPILFVLDELRRHYRVSLVLSTATQPALKPIPKSLAQPRAFRGLPDLTELAPEPERLHQELRRVRLHLPEDFNRRLAWAEVAQSLAGQERVLVVVNTRQAAWELFNFLKEIAPEGTIHLSALMCGQHRAERIEAIKARLDAKPEVPVRVVSTQLIECGVDLDFPVVYRALAGLDSLAQAAGRCNREGRLAQGQVHLFIPPQDPPQGHLRQAAEAARKLLLRRPADPLAPEMFERFFRELYWLGDRDAHQVLRDLHDSQGRFSFRQAEAKFHLIPEDQASVLVRYGRGAELIDRLRAEGPSLGLARAMQRYLVGVSPWLAQALTGNGAVKDEQGQLVQVDTELYDEEVGLRVFDSDRYAPDKYYIGGS